MVSKPNVLFCLALCLVWAAASPLPVQSAAPASNASTVVLTLPQGVNRVVIPLEDGDACLFARAEVDGHQGLFMIDTGSTLSVIDKNFAETWHLAPVESSGSGDAAKLQFFRVERFACGDARFAPAIMASMDLSQFRSAMQLQLAGLIGGDLLGAAPFEIDYQKRTLTEFAAAKFVPPAKSTSVPMTLRGCIAQVEIRVDGLSVEAGVDTGANQGAGLGPAWVFDHAPQLKGRPTWSKSIITAAGDQGFVKCLFEHVEIPGRKPGPLWFNCSRGFSAATTNVGFRTDMNTLGGPILAQARLTFDYAHERMWVDWSPSETVEEMLIRLGNPRGNDLVGVTPLMRAAQAGRADVAEALIGRGADVNAEDHNGTTALMRGIGFPQIVRLMLSHGARTNQSANMGGDTALHLACEGFDADVVRQLLAAGANADATDTHGRTPLERAAEGNQLEIAKALLAAGASPLAEDKQHYNPLTVASQSASPEILAALLDKAGTKAAGASGLALGLAAHSSRAKNVELLLDRGADPNFADEQGTTPLITAAANNDVLCVRLLLDHGANPALRTREGKSAWDIAIQFSAIDVLRILGGPPAH